MYDWCACDDQEDADDVVQYDDTDSATSRQCHHGDLRLAARPEAKE